MRLFATILLSLLCLVSCSRQEKIYDGKSQTEYASFLRIYTLEGGISLYQIINPLEEGKISQYLLIPKSCNNLDEKNLKEKYGECQIIRTPLERIAVTSSCHAYLFSQLDALSNIAVICEAEYVSNSTVKEQIEKGEIANGGNSISPNMEIIISRNCDALLTSSPLPSPLVLPSPDYMETSPLGRAEWMKFYGALVGKEDAADSLFNIVKENYDSIKSADTPSVAPKILAETPYQGTWFLPGGNSTMGILYHDAGYDYPWKDDTHSGSIALSPEAVLSEASDADIWIIKYYSDHDYTLDEFVAQNPYFSQFKAAKEGNVYGCNTQSTDFYDVTPFRPDILLSEIKNLGQWYFKKLY